MTPALVAAERNIRTVMGKMRKFAVNTTEYFTMKNYTKLLLISIVGIFMFAAVSCNKHPVGSKIPLYSYLKPVINPPDTFQIAYNLSVYGDKIAHVSFQSNAVWLVEKLGVGKVVFKAVSYDSTVIIIDNKDTLAMKGGKPYSFIANNNNYTDINNYFVQFTRLSISYDSYEPKFK